MLLNAHGHHIVQATNSVVAIIGGERVSLIDKPRRTTLPATASASRMLRARSTPVPFIDRGGVLEDLVRWADTPGALAVHVIGGQGGVGKTRLGSEACLRLNDGEPQGQAERWQAGVLATGLGQAAIDALAMLPARRFIVVDYAETKALQVETLLRALAENATDQYPARVVLLVRRPAQMRLGNASGGSAWVDSVRATDEVADEVLDAATETILDRATLSMPERAELFTKARTALIPAPAPAPAPHSSTAAEPAESPTFVPAPDLGEALFAQPLMVVMAGYLAARGEAAPESRDAMFEAILDHEARYWKGRWVAQSLTLDPRAHREAVALATFTGVASPDEATYLLGLLPELQGRLLSDLNRVDEWLAGLYPASPGEPHPYRWGVLEPDTLGEHLIRSTLSPDLISVAIDSGREWDLLERPLTVLARAASDPEFAAAVAPAVEVLIPKLVDTALEESTDRDRFMSGRVVTPAALATLCTALGGMLDPIATGVAEAGIPLGHHVIAPLALALAQAAADQLRVSVAEHPRSRTARSHLAGSLNNYAARLSEVGRREDALPASEEAVQLFRALAETNPTAYTPDLALSLNNHANRLSEVGRREDALPASEEAVQLYRALADADPAAYTPDLAMSLNNHAALLSQAGRRGDALPASDETVRIRRALYDTNPTVHSHTLAMSLNNHAALLSQVGHQEEALPVSEEAVQLYRGLADTNPAAHTPALAGALNNQAALLSEVGRLKDALPISEEAVQLYRGLADTNPAAYTPDLAGALSNHANRLSEIGRLKDALPISEEAVQLRRTLADATPAAYTAGLAMSLNNHANRLSEARRREDALRASEEAVQLYRALADANPAAYTASLAKSLNNHANRLSQVGQDERAAVVRAERDLLESI